MRGIRTRLAATLVALVALTVLAIGVGTYAFVDASLRDRLLADARQQVDFNLSVLLPGTTPAPATADAFATSGLPQAFRLRGEVETIADFGSGDVYWPSAALTGSLDTLPAQLRQTVDGGQLGYAWLELGGRPVLVVGGREGAAPPALYFVFPAGAVDDALAQLRLGLLVAGLVAVLVALLAANAVARGILRPVAAAAAAARRIAGGDLAARGSTRWPTRCRRRSATWRRRSGATGGSSRTWRMSSGRRSPRSSPRRR